MNQPFNQPRPSRWSEVDSRRPENMSFAEWAEQQRLRSQNESWARFEASDIVGGCEELLRDAACSGPEQARRERRRRAQADGWTAGEPGE